MTQIDTSTETVEALLDGVSPGPWVRNGALRNGVIRYCVQAFDGEVDITFQVDEKEDATFITAARELVPALLAERDALKAEVVKLRAERNHANDVTDAAVEEIERLKAQAATAYSNGLEAALGLIASLGYGENDWVDNGHEDAYRAIESHKAEWVRHPTALSAITTRTEGEVWNEAIEAAVKEVDCGGCRGSCGDPSNCQMEDVAAILALKRPVKGESHE